MASPFIKEPDFRHGQAPKTAVLLCNLGTPNEPTPKAVKRYLAEFLGDPRVVEIPKFIWKIILHGIILQTRPKKSAAKYAKIWTKEGSPLRFYTEKQALMLQGWLNEKGHVVSVRSAMRYGSPSIPEQLNALKAEGATRILVFPAYPQYSATTTASVYDAVFDWGKTIRNMPELRFVRNYHDHPSYIAALADSVTKQWQHNERGEQLIMSFHGVPQRTLELGDPYHCECLKTARLLAQALKLEPDQYKVVFQSRFGKAKWLQPYTEPTLIAMAKNGVKSVDVICPGFASDCLETLEEINIEIRAAFMQAGGRQFNYINCFNDALGGITVLREVALNHIAGWPTQTPISKTELLESRATALALGAKK